MVRLIKVSKIFLLLLILMIISIFSNSKVGAAETYDCTEYNMSCILPGGIIRGYYLRVGYPFWYCHQYNTTWSWDCTGTDAECTEDSHMVYYSTLSACENNVTSRTGCCSGGRPPGGGGGGGTCNRCNPEELPCPTPLSTTGTPEYELEECRNCQSTGTCAGTEYASCYENPNTVPTANLEVYPNGVATNLNYYSRTFSGRVMNEPIRMVGTYTDTDGVDDIEAVYVWLTKNGSAPQIGRIVPDGSIPPEINTTTEFDSFGFMMRKEGSQWIPYLPNYRHERAEGDVADAWVRYSGSTTSFFIDGYWGSDSVKVDITSIVASGNTVTMDFNMNFMEPHAESDMIEDGKYYLYVMAKDVFSFTPYDNYEGDALACVRAEYGENEIRLNNPWINPSGTQYWDIDLRNPQIVEITGHEVSGTTKYTYNWTVRDSHILYGVVGNIIITDSNNPISNIKIESLTGTGMENVVKTIHPGEFTPTTPDDPIGYYRLDALDKVFLVYDIVDVESSGSVTIDLMDNDEGILQFYLTVFDFGGNTNQGDSGAGGGGTDDPGDDQPDPFNMDDWIITHGGLMYSSGGINFNVRALTDELWDSTNLINRLTESRVDVSSELYGKLGSLDSSALIHSDINKSYNISYNSSVATNYYQNMKSSFDSRLASLDITAISPSTQTLTGSLTNYGEGTGMYYLDRAGLLTVDTPFTCNAKGIFFVQGDLIIQGNILNNNANQDACIFIVSGNVTINQGPNSSDSGFGYDEINAYIFSNGEVNIAADENLDGLYVNGGIHAGQSIKVYRNLPLNARNTFPHFVVNHHSKYAVFGGSVLGSPVEMAKIEVGFKPF